MARFTIFIIVSAFSGITFVLTTALAKSTGADPGYSGGPAGYASGGSDCTACHDDFTQGPGNVEIMNAPTRYRSGAIYNLIVRITDATQQGAGFELSAENAVGHVGQIHISDPTNTDYTNNGHNINYITHTSDGVADSIANWQNNGYAYDYHLQWQAPANNAGSLTLFAAGNAVNDATSFYGDHFYNDHAPMMYAIPGDADGDTDVDLSDFAKMQLCFNDLDLATGEGCEFLDFDQNGDVSLDDIYEFSIANTGPTATQPAEYVLADAIRGGVLYDTWWDVLGVAAPVGDHPLYPEVGTQTGSTTFRCKECHGWDYKGRNGAYGSGSHFTDIIGIENTTKSSSEIFELLKADPNKTPNGHNMAAYGLSDADLWDLVKFTRQGVVNTDDHIDGSNLFSGNALFGSFTYSNACLVCHGDDGKNLNFGDAQNPEYVGTVAVNNPWELLHKMRFGHPGSSMISTERLYYPVSNPNPQFVIPNPTDIGAFTQTLPTE